MLLSGDVETGKKLHKVAGGRKGTEDRHVGHTTQILCMAISSDGKYLVRISTIDALTRHTETKVLSSKVVLIILSVSRFFPTLCSTVLFCLPGHWRHEQINHNLGARNM